MALLHFIVLAASAAAIFYAYDGSFFSWHPVLMVAGAMLTIPVTIITARTYQSKTLHAFFSATGFALVIIAFIVAFLETGSVGSSGHFTSWHSWVGVAALISMFLTAVNGNALFWNLLPLSARKDVGRYHSYWGAATVSREYFHFRINIDQLLLLHVALVLGGFEYFSGTTAQVLAGSTLVITGLVLTYKAQNVKKGKAS